jgi:hypothetical protein
MYFRQTESVKLLHTVCLLAFEVGQDIYEYIIQTECYKLLLRMNTKFFLNLLKFASVNLRIYPDCIMFVLHIFKGVTQKIV